MALMALTEEEPQDVAMGVEADNGAEAWKRLVKRWDPCGCRQNRSLLKIIITPERCRIEDLVGAIKKWEASVRECERRKDENDERLKLVGDLRMTVFESLLQQELENRLVLMKKMLNTYELRRMRLKASSTTELAQTCGWCRFRLEYERTAAKLETQWMLMAS